jgi:hypothetical protein
LNAAQRTPFDPVSWLADRTPSRGNEPTRHAWTNCADLDRQKNPSKQKRPPCISRGRAASEPCNFSRIVSSSSPPQAGLGRQSITNHYQESKPFLMRSPSSLSVDGSLEPCTPQTRATRNAFNRDRVGVGIVPLVGRSGRSQLDPHSAQPWIKSPFMDQKPRVRDERGQQPTPSYIQPVMIPHVTHRVTHLNPRLTAR